MNRYLITAAALAFDMQGMLERFAALVEDIGDEEAAAALYWFVEEIRHLRIAFEEKHDIEPSDYQP